MCFRTMLRMLILVLVLGLTLSPALAQPHQSLLVLDDVAAWSASSAQHDATHIRAEDPTGGNFDVLGEGALLLQKQGDASFWHTVRFRPRGRWRSQWVTAAPEKDVRLAAEVLVYGQPQDMTTGWTKFAGNPLVAPADWHHTTDQTLALPDTLWPQDQALVRGMGPYADQWLLFFNVGAWAVGGWAAAVADSLAPLKRGENPFRLVDPYPLFAGNARGDTLGFHAPNDWIAVAGTWYSPDESRDQYSRMWTLTSSDEAEAPLTAWANRGPIEGIRGHDPGIVFDGERFHLFTEDGNRLQHLSSEDPLGSWTPHGPVLDVGDHTGDADVSYFNNRWHMFFDDAPHLHYQIGHAHTAPGAFPRGWTLTNDVFGPQRPDQGQAWDEDTPEGNRFGTGDADLAVEDQTLYITYERPVGLAFKELDLTDDRAQTVRARLEIDRDRDGTVDATTPWKALRAPQATVTWPAPGADRIRLAVEMMTTTLTESPMIPALRLTQSQ